MQVQSLQPLQSLEDREILEEPVVGEVQVAKGGKGRQKAQIIQVMGTDKDQLGQGWVRPLLPPGHLPAVAKVENPQGGEPGEPFLGTDLKALLQGQTLEFGQLLEGLQTRQGGVFVEDELLDVWEGRQAVGVDEEGAAAPSEPEKGGQGNRRTYQGGAVGDIQREESAVPFQGGQLRQGHAPTDVQILQLRTSLHAFQGAQFVIPREAQPLQTGGGKESPYRCQP